MPPSDRLLELLRKVGRVESEGFFSLDGRKAQEKMREFALVDAHEYVLKFVQAAVAGGATRIEVRADTHGVSVTAHGWEAVAEIFDDLFAGLFLSQSRVEAQEWRHLAIGVNAALALQPRSVEIRAGGRVLLVESTERLTVRDDGDASRGSTRIDVLQRVSWRLAGRALKAMAGGVPEGRLVSERGLWCRVPVTLNGRGVTQAEWADTFRGGVGEVPHDLDAHRGVWLPLGAPATESRVRFVQHGVMVCVHSLEALPMQAVVHGDELLTNASGSDVVVDESYKKRLDEVTRVGFELVAELAKGPGETESVSWWRDVRPYLLALVAQGMTDSPPRSNASDLAALRLRAAPLFKDVVGGPVSLNTILEAKKEGRTVYPCRTELRLSTPPAQLYVQVDGKPAQEALQRVLGAEWLQPLADRLLSERMLSWLTSRARHLDLPTRAAYLVTVPIESGDMRGTLGLSASRRAGSTALIRFLVDGRDVVTKYVDVDGASFDATIDCPRLKPTVRFDDVVNDDVLAEVKALLRAAFEQACVQMAAEWCGESASLPVARAHLMALLRPQSRKTAIDPAIEAFPLFDTVDGRPASIADLRVDLAAFGSVAVIPIPSPGPQGDQRRIVVADRLAVLNRLFGKNVRDYSNDLAQEREGLRKREGPKIRPTLPDSLLTAEFSVGDVHGVIGLPAIAVAQPLEGEMRRRRVRGALSVTFLVSGTIVETRLILDSEAIDLEVGPLEAVVEAPRLTPTTAWDGVLEDAALSEALRAIEEGITALAVRAAERLPHLRAARRTQAMDMLTLYVIWKAKALPPAVLSAPLIATIDGELCTVTQMLEEAAAHGDLYFVPAQPAARRDEEGRMVLQLDTVASKQMVRTLLPDVRLVDRKKELARQSGRLAFLRRPQRPETLDNTGRRYVLRLPIVGAPAGWRGELGLFVSRQQERGGVHVRVLREGRALQELTYPTSVCADAVVAWDHAPVSETWSGLASANDESLVLSVVGQTVQAAIERLLTCDVRPGSDESRLLVRYALGEVKSPNELTRGAPLLVRVAQAPTLEDSTGAPLSLSTLANDYRSAKRLRWLRPGVTGELAAPWRAVRCDVETLERLARVFKKIEDAEPLLEATRATRRKRERAPVVTSLDLGPGPWIARISATRGGLKGELAVSRTPGADVGLVVENRCVERRRLLSGVSLAGVLACDDFRATDDWTEVSMGSQQARALENLVDALFEQVARQAIDSAEARAALFAYYLARKTAFLEAKGSLLPAAAQVAVMPCADGHYRMSLQGAIDIWRSARPALPSSLWEQVSGVVASALAREQSTSGFVYLADEEVEWPYRLLSSDDEDLVYFLQDFFGSQALFRVDGKRSAALKHERERQAALESHRKQEEKREEAERLEALQRAQQAQAEHRKRVEDLERAERQRARQERAEQRADQRRSETGPKPLSPHEQQLQDALVAGFARVCARMAPKWRERFESVTLTDAHIPRLVAHDSAGRPLVARRHPVTQAVLERLPHDRGALAALMSAVYTVVNQCEPDVTDEDEVRFMEELTDWLLEAPSR